MFVFREKIIDERKSIITQKSLKSSSDETTDQNIFATNEILNNHLQDTTKFSKSWFTSSKRSMERLKNKISEEKQILLMNLERKYDILYVEFKGQHFLHRNFIFLDLLRQILFLIVILASDKTPFMQIIIVMIFQFTYCIAAWIIRPFETMYVKLNFAVTELFMTTALFSCLLIGIYDHYEIYDIEQRTKLGWVVPYCNLGLLYWMFLAISIKILAKILLFFRRRKAVHQISEQNK